MDKSFKSKIDKTPVIIRSASVLVIIPVLLLFYSGRENNIMIITGILMEFILMGGLLLALKTTFTITSDGWLIINLGLRKIKINTGDITSIENERSWGKFVETPYVHSIEQLKLNYRKNSSITVTPEHKTEFIKELQNHNRKIMFK